MNQFDWESIRFYCICFMIATLFLLVAVFCCHAEEGDFWRDFEKEHGLSWKVINQNYSHIIYEDGHNRLWTRCHSCFKFLLLKKAHTLHIDRTKQDFPMYVEERRLIFETVYYCDTCYNPDWDK